MLLLYVYFVWISYFCLITNYLVHHDLASNIVLIASLLSWRRDIAVPDWSRRRGRLFTVLRRFHACILSSLWLPHPLFSPVLLSVTRPTLLKYSFCSRHDGWKPPTDKCQKTIWLHVKNSRFWLEMFPDVLKKNIQWCDSNSCRVFGFLLDL